MEARFRRFVAEGGANPCVDSLSSADKNLAWNKIYMTLTCDPQVKHLFTKLTSGESCKKRFTKLKGWYKSNDRKNLQKSGTVEEYGEVDKLLGDFLSLENDAKEISSTQKTTKNAQEKILLQQEKEIRDSSLGAFAARSGEGKEPVASTGELVQCLKLFLASKLSGTTSESESPKNSLTTTTQQPIHEHELQCVQHCLVEVEYHFIFAISTRALTNLLTKVMTLHSFLLLGVYKCFWTLVSNLAMLQYSTHCLCVVIA